MSKYQSNKALILEYFAAMEAAGADGVGDAACERRVDRSDGSFRGSVGDGAL